MIKHNLIQKYFHGCGDCRDCCNGKLFSLGYVTFSDFKTIIRLFPTAFDYKNNLFLYFYSLAPLTACYYYRDGECSIYNIQERPDTCKNFPFGIFDKTITANYKDCPNLNDKICNFPILNNNGFVNPEVMNKFFTEYQYVSNLRNDNKILEDFLDIVFNSNVLNVFPKFKTTNGDIIDITEIDANKNLMVLDIEKINKIIRKMNNPIFDTFVFGHQLSLDNLPLFGNRLLEQI